MKNKKIITMLAVIGVISILTGCGSNNDKTSNKKTSTKTASTTTETETEDKNEEKDEKENDEKQEEINEEATSESTQQAQSENTSVGQTTNNEVQAQSTANENTQTQQNTTTNNASSSNTTSNTTSNNTTNNTQSNTQTTPEVVTPTSVYKDGTYSGSANGFYGSIIVNVTISGDKITSISPIGYTSDEYIEKAQGVINNILASQNTSVDTVSGATFTSNGIINAVNDALSKAKN